jgi:flagellar biosynthesis protein FlhB
MAEGQEDTERSEDPTQKRLDEALDRGDVAKSQEVNTWFVIAGGALLLMAFSGPMANGLATTLRGLVAHSGSMAAASPASSRSSALRSWRRWRSRCCCSRLRPSPAT